METRASHILVGGFVLAFLAGLVAFAIWIAKVDLDAKYREYDIFFEGSVSGLYKRSIVYYLGIPVGDVRDITLAPHDTQQVRVHVRLRDEVPVTEGASARLEFQGLTGVAYIELKGGPQGGSRIQLKEGQEFPIIPSDPSPLLEFYESAPNLVNEAIRTVQQVQKLLSDDNIAEVGSILRNVDSVSANVARGTQDLDTLVADARTLMTQVGETADKISALADTGSALLEEDGRRLVNEAVQTLDTAQALLERIDLLVDANEETITQFVSGSLPEVSRMIVDLRRTARSLSRLVTRIEQNPAEALFGPNEAKFDLESRKVKKEEQQ